MSIMDRSRLSSFITNDRDRFTFVECFLSEHFPVGGAHPRPCHQLVAAVLDHPACDQMLVPVESSLIRKDLADESGTIFLRRLDAELPGLLLDQDRNRLAERIVLVDDPAAAGSQIGEAIDRL